MRPALLLVCAWLCLAAAPQDPDAPVRQIRLPFTAEDGDRFALKYAAILARPPVAAGQRRKPVQTIVSEPELNGYLNFGGAGVLPVGIVEPYIFALGGGRLSGVATVDLDVVRTSRPRGMLDPAQLLRGRVPVTATGVLHSKDGAFVFALESATVAGVDVPKSMLQELVSYYTRSASNPSGQSLDAPFALAGGIREVTVESKRFILIQ